MINPGIGIPLGPKNNSRPRRQPHHQRELMLPIRRRPRFLHHLWRRNNKSISRRRRPAPKHPHRPVRRAPLRNLLTFLVEQISPHMCRSRQSIQIIRRRVRAALFISADRFIQRRSPQRLPRRSPRPKRQRHQNGQHHKQSLRHPKRKKDFQEKTFHRRLVNHQLFDIVRSAEQRAKRELATACRPWKSGPSGPRKAPGTRGFSPCGVLP